MAGNAENGEHAYGIGAVARLTGLTDHTIRVWERRYGAVVARRAANGRRLYSAADVEKLTLLKALTDKGIPISQAAGDDIAGLRERAHSLDAVASAPLPKRIRVALLGDFLPGLLDRAGSTKPLDIVISDNSRERFVADLRRERVDAVVMESAILTAETVEQLREYMAQSRTGRGVLVYGFGQSRDVALASDSSLVVLRSPVTADEIRAAVMRTFGHRQPDESQPAAESPEPSPSDWQFDGEIAPRRFNQQQLATLVNTSSAVECECPQHLAQLVGDLSAFEIYSASCANRNEDDAALHRYLHLTTAQARALIEEALEKVAEAEGLAY